MSFFLDVGGLYVFFILFYVLKVVKEMFFYVYVKKENLIVEIYFNVIVGGIRVYDESILCFSRINW